MAPGLIPPNALTKTYGPDAMPNWGPVPFPSGATLSAGDPVKSSGGLGYLATGTNAILGILADPVPEGWNPSTTKQHWPNILPADDQTVWLCQSIGTKYVSAGLMQIPSKKYRIGGTTSGYTGIDFTHTTGGVLLPLGLAPIYGNGYGSYAQVLVIITRGTFYGQA